MYFKLHIVYLYTNIIFSEEDRLDEEALYDTLVKSGLMQLILDNIDQNELGELQKNLYAVKEQMVKYHNSFKGSIEDLGRDLMIVAEKIKQMTPQEWNTVFEHPFVQAILKPISYCIFLAFISFSS